MDVVALTQNSQQDQGGGKRKGAFAIYLEPWHADIFNWLELRKNHGKEEVGYAHVLMCIVCAATR